MARGFSVVADGMDGCRNNITLFKKEDDTSFHVETKSQAAPADMWVGPKKGEMASCIR